MTTLHITIRRNTDGVIRTAHWPNWHPWSGEGDEYWWSEGSFGCDCNRAAVFARAAGDEPVEDGCQCGEDGYSVLSITQDDDPTVVYRDADLDDRRRASI